jgi:hypothetical protein
MSDPVRIDTAHGVRLHGVRMHRVGYQPDPWAWTPWEYAGDDGRFHGRWDDPHGTWRTLYLGASPPAPVRRYGKAAKRDHQGPDPVSDDAVDETRHEEQ